MQASGPRVALLFALPALLLWPFDPTLAIAPVAIGVLLIVAFALPRTRSFADRPTFVLSVAHGLLLAVFGAWLGHVGTGSALALAAVGPWMSVSLLVDARIRPLLVVGLTVVLWTGIVLARDRGNPFPAALATLGSAVGAAITGQVVYALTRDAFITRLRLTTHEQRLRDLDESLEDRVADKALAVRRLAQHLEIMREEERKWMQREIHDELGQELTALRFAVAVARVQSPEGGAAFDEIESLLERTRATMRRILAQLRPRVLDELGLVAALGWLTKDVSARTAIAVDLRVEPPDLHLVGDGATIVFRIVQEALTNVARHASAKQAWVSLAVSKAPPGEALLATPEQLVITISDDGVGIDPDQKREEGLGLIGMRERADAVGGEARWTRREGGGTEVWARLPYPVELVEGRRTP